MNSQRVPVCLYLEDDQGLLDDFGMYARGKPLNLKLANSIDAAKRLMRDGLRPSAFLFDVELRDRLDGFEFAAMLCEQYGFPPQRFVFLTAWDERFSPPDFLSDSTVFRKSADADQVDQIFDRLIQISSGDGND